MCKYYTKTLTGRFPIPSCLSTWVPAEVVDEHGKEETEPCITQVLSRDEPSYFSQGVDEQK